MGSLPWEELAETKGFSGIQVGAAWKLRQAFPF